MAIKFLQPKLPLELDQNNNFVKFSDILQNAKQKLKMLLLTNPGEKIFEPNFGVGIYKYLFSQNFNDFIIDENGEQQKVDIQSEITDRIIEQTARYASDIIIQNVSITQNNNIVLVTINYSVDNFLDDELEIIIEG